MSAAAEIIINWILFISASFPSDSVLLEFCDEFVPVRGYEYVEVIGHVADSPDQFSVFFRLVKQKDDEDFQVESIKVVHLDNDQWLVLNNFGMNPKWLELKIKE